MPSFAPNLALAAMALVMTTRAASLEVLSTTRSGAFAFSLGNGTYYSPTSTVFEGSFNTSSANLLPLTVLRTNETSITAEVLGSLISTYAVADDVWTEEFLGSALAISAPPGAVLDASASSWIASIDAKYFITSADIDVTSLHSSQISRIEAPGSWSLQPGPYTISIDSTGTSVRKAYALRRDKQEAFLFGVTSMPNSDAYETVDLFIPTFQDAWVPVPSRLYWLDDERPLAGLRVGLKDIYDLEGVRTGGGSRSYTEVYPAVNQTAVSIQKLLDLGAVVIGKTKTSQFAHGADPWQFVDIHYPWNPRGDGYLTAASSSSGSAAAIAAYEWLDITIGSDTRGSVRKPAAMVGSYGMRPTWNSMDLTGVLPLATEFDTAGFFARDPELFYKISNLWFAESPAALNNSFTSFPTKLIYPLDYFPLLNPEAQSLYDNFMDTLERELGMIRTPLNFTETLNASLSNPQITNLTAFQLSSNRLAEYVSYNEIGKPLEKAWEAMFPGLGYPPLDPNPRAAFQRSVNLTDDDYQAAVDIKNEFRDFFLAQVLRPDSETCSDGIMILDMGTSGLPSYREQALNTRPGATSLTITTPAGPIIPSNYLASTSGSPQIGIPIGQVTYQSYISLQEEVLPINVDLVAAPGCDGMLLALLQRLAELGIAKTVKVGKTAF